MPRRSYNRYVIYVCAVIMVVWSLTLIAWTVNMSLQTEDQIHKTPPDYWPKTPTLYNYWVIPNIAAELARRTAALSYTWLPIQLQEIPSSAGNSLLIAGVVVLINIALGPLAAYGFGRLPFRGSTTLFFAAFGARLFPAVVIIIPAYILIKSIGLMDTIYSLMLTYSAFTLPFTIWIVLNFLMTVPREMEDAARIDGYSLFGVYRKITFPLLTPALVTSGILAFMTSYTEFFFALIFTQTYHSHTLPVIIGSSIGYVLPIGLFSAASIVTMIPPLLVMVFFNRYIVRGITAGVTR